MKRYDVTFSEGGKRDIEKLAGATSDKFVEALIRTCESLSLFPYRGTARPELRPNMRIIGYKRTAAILFRIEEKSRTVIILAVSYRGQSFDQAFLCDE